MSSVRFLGIDTVEYILTGEEVMGFGYSMECLRDDDSCRQEFLDEVIVPVATQGVGGGVTFTEAQMQFIGEEGTEKLRTFLHCPDGKQESPEIPEGVAELFKQFGGDAPCGENKESRDGFMKLLERLIGEIGNDDEEIEEFAVLVEFKHTEDAIRFSKVALPRMGDVGSSLFKMPESSCLILFFSGECRYADALMSLAAEYGAATTEDEARIAQVKEHGRELIDEDAVEQLAGL